MQDFNKNAFPLGWLKMIRKYEAASMYEECCDKAENVDKEVININSDKFDIDVWKVFTREKLMRQKDGEYMDSFLTRVAKRYNKIEKEMLND